MNYKTKVFGQSSTCKIISIVGFAIFTLFATGCAITERSSYSEFEWLLWSFERRYATVENPESLDLPHPPAERIDKSLHLLNDYTVVREPGNEGVRSFVFVKDGESVLEHNATNHHCADYYRTGPLKVYLTDFVSGEYKRVSNVLAYQNPSTEERVKINESYTGVQNKKRINLCWKSSNKIDLQRTKNNTVKRSESSLDNLTWVVMKNGVVVLERSAGNERTYRYKFNGGGVVSVFLKGYVDGGYQRVSNIVSYNTYPPMGSVLKRLFPQS